MSLALVYQEAFKTIVRIQSGKLKGQAASQVQQALLDLFGSVQEDAKHGRVPYSLERLEDAEFALAAFADESALLSPDSVLSDRWAAGPKGSLTQQLFNQPNAGNDFYRRLERISRANTREAGEVLEVYSLCLVLGYSGARNDKERQSITQNLLPQVERLLGKAPDLSTGDEYLSETVDPPLDVWNRRLRWAAGVLAIVLAVAYVAMLVDLGDRWQKVSQLATFAGGRLQ